MLIVLKWLGGLALLVIGIIGLFALNHFLANMSQNDSAR